MEGQLGSSGFHLPHSQPILLRLLCRGETAAQGPEDKTLFKEGDIPLDKRGS